MHAGDDVREQCTIHLRYAHPCQSPLAECLALPICPAQSPFDEVHVCLEGCRLSTVMVLSLPSSLYSCGRLLPPRRFSAVAALSLSSVEKSLLH